MQAATAPGSDHVPADFLDIAYTRYLRNIYHNFRRKGSTTSEVPPKQSFFIRRAIGKVFGFTVRMPAERVSQALH
ncbi:unnamed protein product [Strongylus vulgaris]|uniref:Uncharacterized protein n=1 Tax=Strongylus vulgaris TaxID=40348 RepID=A0A3P7ILG8_STRVU|nr:unnamed protein product [Strongylus vulgaris]